MSTEISDRTVIAGTRTHRTRVFTDAEPEAVVLMMAQVDIAGIRTGRRAEHTPLGPHWRKRLAHVTET